MLTASPGDRDPVAGAGVGAGEDGSAEPGVDRQLLRPHQLDRGRALLVPELNHVEVANDAVGLLSAEPSEEDVAGRTWAGATASTAPSPPSPPAYADQNDRDYAALAAAAKQGRVAVQEEPGT